MIRRILFIAYYYPPCGGPASIRAGKTVKYLLKKGIEVDVVTAKNVFLHSTDETLVEESQPTRIYYASSIDVSTPLYWFSRNKKAAGQMEKATDEEESVFKRIYFSLPEGLRAFLKGLLPVDDKILWLYSAKKAALDNLRKREYDLIMTTLGPYTCGLAVYSLKKQTNMPVLIDFRDHWTLNPYVKPLTFLHKKIAGYWEKKIAETADYLTFAGETMQRQFLNKYPHAKAKCATVYNGYDESDFQEAVSVGNPGEVVFTYTGHFYRKHSPYYFCRALIELKKQGKLDGKIKVFFVGNYHKDARHIIESEDLKSITKIVPYVDHSQSVEMLLKSDCLLLFIPTKEGKGVLTSKIFEYIRSGKHILAMIPGDGEAADLIRKNCEKTRYTICVPEDITMIATAIQSILMKKQKSDISETSSTTCSDLSREAQTDKLFNLINNQNG